MKITFAQYEHFTIGFPGVKLKWHSDNGQWLPPYITENGIIQHRQWVWRNSHPEPFMELELRLFDEWVRLTFANDPSVQG